MVEVQYADLVNAGVIDIEKFRRGRAEVGRSRLFSTSIWKPGPTV
jgi:hypothetical protein